MSNGTARESPLMSRRVRLRLLLVFSLAFCLYVGADIFELPFLRHDFQADPTILGIIVGAILALAGIEFISRLPGFGPVTKDDNER